MPTLELLESPLGPALTVEAAGRLLDVVDDAHGAGAPVAFACRSANCGTCLVDVLAGADALEPARPDELEVLALTGALPGQRLACQVVVRTGPGLVRLRWVGPRRTAG